MLLVLTESCSMGCTHCMDRAVPCDRHMTEETLRDALHFLTINQAAMHLIVTGGEPTEHPRFVDMMGIIIDTLDKNGQPCAVTITSNGFWCLEHQEEAKRIAKGTKNVHVFWQISTDTRYYPKTLPTHKRLWREDGRKTYESYVMVPVGSVRNLILNEVRYRLERQLRDAEQQFKEL